MSLNIRRKLWFMHDGAPPHTTGNVRQYLNNMFQNRWIGRGGPVLWPPRSPDLTCLDYFLWGYVKNLVYELNPPINVESLKTRIRNAFQSVTPAMINNVHRSFNERIQLCIHQNGQNFEHLLQ